MCVLCVYMFLLLTLQFQKFMIFSSGIFKHSVKNHLLFITTWEIIYVHTLKSMDVWISVLCIHMYMTCPADGLRSHGPHAIKWSTYYGRMFQKFFFVVRSFQIGIPSFYALIQIRRRRTSQCFVWQVYIIIWVYRSQGGSIFESFFPMFKFISFKSTQFKV